jgi:hypothetical protein
VQDALTATTMDQSEFRYAVETKATDITVTGPQIPFPEVRLSFAGAAMGLTMPVSKSDAPQPFSFLTRLSDLTISDEIWSMFDPTAAFPRDPVTIVVDTKGTATLLADMFDEAAMASGQPPADLNTLSLTELRAKAFGAEATGTGDLTFDNSDKVTFDGVPAPSGEVVLAVTGANALIDKLVAMGFVPEEQAMGARMMMAMFFRPGDAQDSLTSTIEFKDKGIYANGQKLR